MTGVLAVGVAFRVAVGEAVGVAFSVAFRVAVGMVFGMAVSWRVGVVFEWFEWFEWHDIKCVVRSCVLKWQLKLWLE